MNVWPCPTAARGGQLYCAIVTAPWSLRQATVDDANALAHVLVTATEHAFDQIVPAQCLAFPESQSAANWRRTLCQGLPPGDFMPLVEVGGQVIGYAWGAPNHHDPVYRGKLKQINLLPAHQRQGIGRILVQHVACTIDRTGNRQHVRRSVAMQSESRVL